VLRASTSPRNPSDQSSVIRLHRTPAPASENAPSVTHACIRFTRALVSRSSAATNSGPVATAGMGDSSFKFAHEKAM